MVVRATCTLALVASLLLAGCGMVGADTASQSGTPRVLAAESFLRDIAQNVAGERLTVASLLPPLVDAHEYQPTPQDAIKIAQSQVLIINGLGYETWLTKEMQDGGEGRVLVVASDGLASAAKLDPHLWMNPLHVIQYAVNIRDGLSRADPAGSTVYSANAEAYARELTELDRWIKGEVAQIPPERRVLVTNHEVLGPFAQAYGFHILGAVIPSVTNEASPSAQQVVALIKTIQAAEAPAIFVDIQENQKLADQIASESGAKVISDLYVETLSASDGPAATYLDMMRYDVSLIVEALK